MLQRYCGARKIRSEGTCTRPAGWGTTHPGVGSCKFHSGATPNGEKSARRQQAQALVARYAATPVETDPYRALSGLLAEAQGNVLALRAHVLDLGDIADEGGAHPMIRLYSEERDRLHKVARDCAALGLLERQTGATEAVAFALIENIRAAISRAGLAPNDEARLLRELAATIREGAMT